jgi:hypothetical protein
MTLLTITAVFALGAEPDPPADDPPATAEAAPAVAPARDAGLGFGGGPLGREPGYSIHVYPPAEIAGSDESFSLIRQQISAGAPVWTGDRSKLLFLTNVRHTLFQTDLILPDTGRPFPEQLWSVSFGLTSLHTFENGWSAGASLNFGSASDQPFGRFRDLNLGTNAFLRVPAKNEPDAWIWSVMYSPVGNLNFPVPGVAYQWVPNEQFKMAIGLPFTIQWQPNEDWRFSFFYVPLTNIVSRLTYQLADCWTAFGSYEFASESYFLADRVDDRDRFMAFEQRLTLGLRRDIGRYAAFEAFAGYAFARSYGEGRNQGGDLRDRVDVDPGGFAGAALRMRF